MGAASDLELLARAVRNPGRLVLAPASVSGSFPYGGTSLGFVREARLTWDTRYDEGRDPSSGAVAEIARLTVDNVRLALLLEGPQWDEDTLVAIFNATTPSGSLASATPPETRIDGTLIPRLVDAWAPLLFVADDPKHKSVYFRRPVPRLAIQESTRLSQRDKAGLPIVFDPTADSAWQSIPYFQIARLANLHL